MLSNNKYDLFTDPRFQAIYERYVAIIPEEFKKDKTEAELEGYLMAMGEITLEDWSCIIKHTLHEPVADLIEKIALQYYNSSYNRDKIALKPMVYFTKPLMEEILISLRRQESFQKERHTFLKEKASSALVNSERVEKTGWDIYKKRLEREFSQIYAKNLDELTTLYEEKTFEIHPTFQLFFDSLTFQYEPNFGNLNILYHSRLFEDWQIIWRDAGRSVLLLDNLIHIFRKQFKKAFEIELDSVSFTEYLK